MGGKLWFGTRTGDVVRGWVGGSDDGRPFVCKAALPADHLGDPAAYKAVGMMQAVWSTRLALAQRVSVGVDYVLDFPPAPAASEIEVTQQPKWDVSPWVGTAWSARTNDLTQAGWSSVPGAGFAFAPQVQLTSASPGKVVARLQRVDVTFMAGMAGV